MEKPEIEITDWTEYISTMPRERLEKFAINAMGLLSTMGPFTKMTPQDIFNKIYAIGEIHPDFIEDENK